ncbi:Lztr1 [Symbiodinium sp. CCMP2592]|nr:Lztr1 [Symbiodinium sp. CCMP2592]
MRVCIMHEMVLVTLFAAPDAQVNSWTQLSPSGSVLNARTYPGMAPASGNQFYVFGGFDGTSRLRDLHRYSILANSWTELSPGGSVPSARSVPGMTWSYTDDELYVFGGDAVSQLNDLHRYSVSANSWTQLTPGGTVPSTRQAHGMVYSQTTDGLYVFGGWGDSPIRSLNDLYRYSISANSWTQLSPGGSIPSARNGHGMAFSQIDNELYVFGGENATGYLNDLYRYTISADAWTALSPGGIAPEARQWLGMAWCHADNGVYIFGGSGYSGYLNDLHRYDPGEDVWSEMGPGGTLPTARYGHGMVWSRTDNGLYVFGGNDGSYLNDLHRYEPVTTTSTTSSASTTTSESQTITTSFTFTCTSTSSAASKTATTSSTFTSTSTHTSTQTSTREVTTDDPFLILVAVALTLVVLSCCGILVYAAVAIKARRQAQSRVAPAPLKPSFPSAEQHSATVVPRPAPQNEHRDALLTYMRESDVKLVRGGFFVEQSRMNIPLTRRQETPEHAFVEDPDTAETWFAVSHVWESRENADPYGHQRDLLAEYVETFSKHNAAFFYDQLSLNQHVRNPEQDKKFRLCMQNMHLLYASEATKVLRIEGFASEDRREARENDTIRVYDDTQDEVHARKISEFRHNTTPYNERGWCVAECQWSACGSKPSQLLPVPVDERGIPEAKTGLAPMLPEEFEDLVKKDQLKFTHTDDLESVVRLQREVFEEMAKNCQSLTKAKLPIKQMRFLAESLPKFDQLHELTLINCDLDVKIMGDLVHGLGGVVELVFHRCTFTSEIIKTAMHGIDRSKLNVLDLSDNCLTDAEANILEEAFRGRLPASLETVDLRYNDISSDSVQRLHRALDARVGLKADYSRLEVDLE